jgi:hypothetical protein
MKAYVLTTGAIFGLIVVAHIWRIAVEGSALAKDPIYMLLTLASGVLAWWSWRVFRIIRA